MRLGTATLSQVPADPPFAYERDGQQIGIVHFGIGAFHRAHQAWYTDLAMERGDRNWLISGVSLRSAGVADQLNPQDGLYTVAERSAEGTKLRVIGAVGEVLVGTRDAEAIVARLAAPTTHIASFTVTEKGYCRAPDGSLDLALAGEGSIYAFLGAGLAARRQAGLPGLTLLSCDNLADNGRQLERLMHQWCAASDPALGDWIAQTCTFPATMVDRIVPATTDADRAEIEAVLGLRDEAVVMTEPFSQWVIEDRFAGPRPCWEQIGAELVQNVAAYETAKLRMLNGAHSALAYLGLAQGHTYVHEAIADAGLRPLIEHLMREEALPTIAAAPGQDLPAYANALVARFANPALQHRLIQIAMDGSQKIPQRWLETLSANAAAGRRCPSILAALKAWLRHLRGANGRVDDPLGESLGALVANLSDRDAATALFAPGGLLGGTWTPTEADLSALG